MANLRVLHVLAQKPGHTGSGLYVRSLIKEGLRSGHITALLAASDKMDTQSPHIHDGHAGTMTLRFGGKDLPFAIPGMSDVMPYDSTRFRDMSEGDLDRYRERFSAILKKGVKSFHPQVIHCHHLWLLTSMTRKIFPDIPVVATCHGTDLRQFRALPEFREEVLTGCRGLDGVMSLTSFQREEIHDLYGIDESRIHVIGSGYDEGLFHRREKSIPPPLLVAYGGKISSAKGIPWLARAIGEIEAPTIELHVAGSGTGPDGRFCVEKLGELGKKVVLHGPLSPLEMANLMGRSHIFVLPSLHEGLPMVLPEAMASGCRIVSTGLPGILEAFDGPASDAMEIIPPPRSSYGEAPLPEVEDTFTSDIKKALMRQIARAQADPQGNDLPPVSDKFRWSRVYQKIERLYLAVIADRVLPGLRRRRLP